MPKATGNEGQSQDLLTPKAPGVMYGTCPCTDSRVHILPLRPHALPPNFSLWSFPLRAAFSPLSSWLPYQH